MSLSRRLSMPIFTKFLVGMTLCFAALFASFDAKADVTPGNKKFGIGLQAGYPSGLTLKAMASRNEAWVFGIGVGSGWAFFNPGLSLHADYVVHPSTLINAAGFDMSWYFGVGGWANIFNGAVPSPYGPNFLWYPFFSSAWFGARVPIGLSMAVQPIPLEIYAEAVPSLLVFPQIAFGSGVDVGFRLYF